MNSGPRTAGAPKRCDLRLTYAPKNPTIIRDFRRNPEENLLFGELKRYVKEAIKKLPQRERDLIEAKFFQDKKLRELSDEYNISASRISRIIQSGLNKIKAELAKKNLIN